MKTWHWLGLILAFGFASRVLISAGRVFSGGYLNFISPDSYYHADIMRQGLAVFPHYFGSPYDYFVVAVTWLIGLGHPTPGLLEHISIFIPPLFAIVTICLVYFIGKRLFNNTAGIIAALVVSVIPGEFFARSLLGNIDHHAAEVLITTAAAALAITIFTIKDKAWWKYALCFIGIVFSLLIYRATWGGAAAALSLSAPTFPQAALSTTTEAVHVWGLPGNYVPLIDCFAALLFYWVAFRKGAGWKRFIIIAWALFMVMATVWQLRFDYYLIIPTALLVGYGLTLIKGAYIKYLLTFCIIAGIVVSVYGGMIKSNLDTPSKEWNQTLEWVKANTPPDTIVAAWWEYGYWIRYRAERIAYITGGQEADRIYRVANCLLSFDDAKWPDGIDYLIIDTNTAFNFKRNITTWAGRDYQDIDWQRTLVYRLYTGDSQIYGETIKVFKIGEGK